MPLFLLSTETLPVSQFVCEVMCLCAFYCVRPTFRKETAQEDIKEGYKVTRERQERIREEIDGKSKEIEIYPQGP